VGAITVGLHVQEYQRHQQFHGSAFDRAHALSAVEPNLFWLAVDIAGAILDLGTATRAMRLLARPAREAVQAISEALGVIADTHPAQAGLREAGNAQQPGLGDRRVQSANRAQSDAGFLQTIGRRATGELSNLELGREFEIAQRSPSRRVFGDPEYLEEVVLGTSTWKRSRDGRWCRFASPGVCFILGQQLDASAQAISAAHAAERASGLQVTFAAEPSRRPQQTEEMTRLASEITARGDDVPEALLTRLREAEARLRRIQEVDRLSSLPSNFTIQEASVASGRWPDLPSPPVALVFPDGTRVWRESPGGAIRHESVRGPSLGRAGMEHAYYSLGQHGNLPRGPKYKRVHTLGQGTGFESPYGIRYAPSYVNQTLQNNGVEEYMRRLTAAQQSPSAYRVVTSTETHADTLRLKRIRYRVEVISDGQAHHFSDYTIDVSSSAAHPVVTANPIAFANNPVAQAHAGRVAVPDILRQTVSQTL